MQNRIVNVSSYRNFQPLTTINERVSQAPADFADECERIVDSLLEEAAEYILYGGSHIVMLGGPSGSGKTTISRRLTETLEKKGCLAHHIEMDNYFRTLDRSDYSLDWESPDRIDTELLTSHIRKLSCGEEVLLPSFDFTSGVQTPNQTPIRLVKNEIIIFEGIHALNEQILSQIQGKAITVYVSTRMRVRDETHVIFRPEWMRFLRRGLRDTKYRGTTLDQTLKRWVDVKRGERENIIPSKKRAAIMLDTSLDYEVNVLAPMLTDAVRELDWDLLRELRMTRMLEAMERFKPMSPEKVPERSILREFLGK